MSTPVPALVAQAKEIALGHSLDPALVCALIEQESGWNPWAIRYEPKFMIRYVAPLFTNNKITATEAYARSFSWGLLQVMGQVARESGYSGPLSQLCDPAIGIYTGCKVFAKKLSDAKQDLPTALLHWNGGAQTDYPQQVMNRIAKYQ